MRLKASAAGVLAGAALLAAPVAAHAATPNVDPSSTPSPCAAAGGFDQVQVGQSLAQVQQEMGSAGNPEINTQGGSTREEITWRNCSSTLGSIGALDYAVTFYSSPTMPLTVNSKTQLALLGG